MKFLKTFSIRNKKVSIDGPSYIIAEIGINHNGSIRKCKKLIKEAFKCGADAAKLQIVNPDNSYEKNHPSYKAFKNKDFSFSELKELIQYSNKLGITLFATPGDFQSLKKVIKLKMPAIKISSGLLTNLPLIKEAAKIKIPLILSSGMAYENEIQEAINICKNKTKKLSLLKCTSIYPAPLNKINLKGIAKLKNMFKIPTGYSDHCLGIEACVCAVAAGATIIEKHFTLNKKDVGADHKISIVPNEFRLMVKRIRETEKLMGLYKIGPTNEEKKLRNRFHRKIVSLKKIKKGEKFSLNNVSLKRSNSKLRGLPPKKLFKIIGKNSKKNINPNKLITSGDFTTK